MTVPRLQTEIVLVDVVRFSGREDAEQYRIIQAFESVVRHIRLLSATSIHRNDGFLVGFIPTGDGFYAVLHPGVFGYGVPFALGVQSLMLLENEDQPGLLDGVRVAVHAGSAIPFRDVTDRLNFVGTGMNDAARLLALRGSDLKRAEAFAGGASYAVASSMALSQFHRRYRTETPEGEAMLRTFQFTQSEARTFEDHHQRAHQYHCIRTDSRIVYAPPRMGALDLGTLKQVDELLLQVMSAPTSSDH
jgi:hypothetical protein